MIKCYNCGSENIDESFGGIEWDGDYVKLSIRCNECHHECKLFFDMPKKVIKIEYELDKERNEFSDTGLEQELNIIPDEFYDELHDDINNIIEINKW